MKIYDVIIVGSGPAGMTAAIYAKRANLDVLLLDKLAPGGQIINTYEIQNYPGFSSVNGADLAMQVFEHSITALWRKARQRNGKTAAAVP